MESKPDQASEPEAHLVETTPQPRLGTGFVSRQRLLQALTPSRTTGVVALMAPLGYGKTTLLIDHAQRQERPVAWVALDVRDNDAVFLIRHIVAALEPVLGVDDSLGRALAAPGASIWRRLMPRLVAAFALLPSCLVVLDDIHELTSADARDVVAQLILHVPEDSQLVISGRSGDGLSLTRLRMEGRLFEVGTEELAFDDKEAHDILLASGASISVPRAANLNHRCEGWPAGVRLAALSGRNGEGGAPPSLPHGRDRDLSDYVRTEFLGRLGHDEARFMVRTSVLQRLSAGLCDAVLGDTGSGETLRRLEASNAFVMALDREQRWYRCHDLVRQALMAELERVDPELPAQLRHRAAEWHALHGVPDEAVRYEQEAGDKLSAARLIGIHAQAVFGQGRLATVIEWLEWAEMEGLVDADPSLAMSGGVALALNGDAERADRFFAALEQMEWHGPPPDSSPSIDAWKSLVRSLSCRRGAGEALADATEAYQLIPITSNWRRLACASLGLALLMDDQAEQADVILAEAADAQGSPPIPNARAISLALRAVIALRAGDVAPARAALEEAEEIRRDHALSEQGPHALQDALVARLAFVDGDPQEARRRLAHAQGLRSLLTWAVPGLAAITRLELARAHLSMSDPAGARTLVLEIGDVLHRRPDLGHLGDETDEVREQLKAIRGGIAGSSTLTGAELRLVPMLATHLTFREVGARLSISENTVKTQAMSTYRKLDATSRSEAVEHAVQAGLLDPAAVSAVLMASGRG